MNWLTYSNLFPKHTTHLEVQANENVANFQEELTILKPVSELV